MLVYLYRIYVSFCVLKRISLCLFFNCVAIICKPKGIYRIGENSGFVNKARSGRRAKRMQLAFGLTAILNGAYGL